MAVSLAGCGVGAGDEAADVHLRVTDGFGVEVLAEPTPPKQSGSDTVLRLLQRNAEVSTRDGGGFVQAIDGLRGEGEGGSDWFFFVNGVLSDRGAAAWRLREGDRVWWDRHRWERGQVDAVVGDFPEPMRRGSGGRWRGAQLDCRAGASVCEAARAKLTQAGIAVTVGAADAAGARTRVVVGPWRRIARAAPELADLRDGPQRSGVYAELGSSGTVAPLDADARPVASASVGGEPDGLVAAMVRGSASPVWVVTGPDDRAARSAVQALSPSVLAGRAAVVVRSGEAFPLPWRSGADGRDVGS